MEGFVTGIHQSPLRGHSVEYAEHRAYNEGESIKNLDWKVLAKTGKKYIKEFIEETNLRCHIFMDVSSSMYYPSGLSKIRFAALTSASLAYVMHKQRDAFRLTAYSDEAIEFGTELRSTRTHLNTVIHQIEPYWKGEKEITTQDKFTYKEWLNGVKKRNVVVILSDLLFGNKGNPENEFWETLSYFHYLKCEVIVMHIADDQTELELKLGEQPLKFIDLETNEAIRLTPDELSAAYIANEKNRRSYIKKRCLELGIAFVDCNVSQPIEKVLNAFYIHRNSPRS